MLTSNPSCSQRCWASCCRPCAATWTMLAWRMWHTACVPASGSSVRSKCPWLIWTLKQGTTQRRRSYGHQKRKAKTQRFDIFTICANVFFILDIFDCLTVPHRERNSTSSRTSTRMEKQMAVLVTRKMKSWTQMAEMRQRLQIDFTQ